MCLHESSALFDATVVNLAGMQVRKYLQNVLCINTEVIPNLPPYQANQSLSNDCVLDILLFGTPKAWQQEMERQGFDPMNKNVQDVMEFMERIESTEDFDGEAQKPKAKSNKKPKDKEDKGDKKKKYCEYHGENYTHTSKECLVLHPELKKKNKTWSRKATDEKKKTKLDLAAIVKKEVAKASKKAAKSATKKRKEAESDSEDEDLCAFDAKDLNYEDMENLRIDSEDDEVSV